MTGDKICISLDLTSLLSAVSQVLLNGHYVNESRGNNDQVPWELELCFTSLDLSVEGDEILYVVLVFVTDGSELGVLHQIRVVLLAVGVGTVDAKTHRRLAALHTVVPRAEPLLSEITKSSSNRDQSWV